MKTILILLVLTMPAMADPKATLKLEIQERQAQNHKLGVESSKAKDAKTYMEIEQRKTLNSAILKAKQAELRK